MCYYIHHACLYTVKVCVNCEYALLRCNYTINCTRNINSELHELPNYALQYVELLSEYRSANATQIQVVRIRMCISPSTLICSQI